MEPLNNHTNNNQIENSALRVQTETKEISFEPYDGCCALLLNLVAFFGSIVFIVVPSIEEVVWLLGISIPCLIASFICFFGLYTIQPGEAQVLVFYGTYKGTVKKSGFFWSNPLFSFTNISLKSRNLNGHHIKVNDKKGNPIEIAIVVVWRVKNTARALFDVENYNNFVIINSESAVRHLALMYPYDKATQDEVSLRSGSDIITRELVSELHGRLDKAGIEVEEARITHLAYAPEIANAMLRRQQAEAIIEAREKIVQGAISIVGHAIQSLKSNDIVDLKEDEKAKLVSNMLVVLCSETQVHPVIKTN
jgi:regulator of protease activity HflC (stomatin/prohibitin superfamily)